MGRDLGQARWRVSARSNGANSCVEARINGDSVVVRNSNDPLGPSIAMIWSTWLGLLEHVAAGLIDYSALSKPVAVASLLAHVTSSGKVVLSCGEDVVHFTKVEWDVFVAGVTLDGEFTLDWLLQAPSHA